MTNETPSYFYMPEQIRVTAQEIQYGGSNIFRCIDNRQVIAEDDKFTIGYIRDKGTPNQTDVDFTLRLNVAEQNPAYVNKIYVCVTQTSHGKSTRHSEYHTTYDLIRSLMLHLCLKAGHSPQDESNWGVLIQFCTWLRALQELNQQKFGKNKRHIPLVDAIEEFESSQFSYLKESFPSHWGAMNAILSLCRFNDV